MDLYKLVWIGMILLLALLISHFVFVQGLHKEGEDKYRLG